MLKREPDEPIGVVCNYGDSPTVVEYSEISKELSELKDPQNKERLAYCAGNVANHFFTLDFLKTVW